MKTWPIAASVIGGIFASDIIRLSAVILKKNMEADGMPEYIEREAAIESIMSEPQDAHYPHWYAVKINSIPAVNVAPVRHGRWDSNDLNVYKWAFACSECGWVDGYPFNDRHNYCPNCGAKMNLTE